MSAQLLALAIFDKVKTAELSHLKQHNFVSFVDIKTKFSAAAYI